MSTTLKTDSSAAKGIANRTGLGKVRHVEVARLWLQDKVRNSEINAVKVKGTENIADAWTKYIGKDEISWHMSQVNQSIEEGRHELNPKYDMIATNTYQNQTKDLTEDYESE